MLIRIDAVIVADITTDMDTDAYTDIDTYTGIDADKDGSILRVLAPLKIRYPESDENSPTRPLCTDCGARATQDRPVDLEVGSLPFCISPHTF